MYTQSKALAYLFRTVDQMAKALGFQDYDAFARQVLELNVGDQGARAAFTMGVRSAEETLRKAAPREGRAAVRVGEKIFAIFKRFPTKASIEEAVRQANNKGEPPQTAVLQECRQSRQNMKMIFGLIGGAFRKPAAIIGRTLAGRKQEFARTPEKYEADIQKELRKQEGNGERPSREKAKAVIAEREGCSKRTIEIILKDRPRAARRHSPVRPTL
jgi:hypothetical protein